VDGVAVNETFVRLEEVSFAYEAERPALADVSLELAAGENVGLVGHVGCGKTTLLHLIVGLIKPTAGTIFAFGGERRVEADFHEVRARAGLVFQDSDDQLFCPTVVEDVAFGPLNLGRSPEEALETAAKTLDLLGISGFEDRITSRALKIA
jgi:cobalt/nickel transport system ATP-binding protein